MSLSSNSQFYWEETGSEKKSTTLCVLSTMKSKWTKSILKSQYKCIVEFLHLINVFVIANGVIIIL